MIVFVEILFLCLLFTLMVYVMSRNPIKTLYNYPPKVIERVKSMPEYKDMIPTTKNIVFAKTLVSILIIIVVSLILRYINGYTTFSDAFFNSYLIWTIVNIYDVVVMDIIWFCHSPKFIFEGTEDIKDEYRNYFFHIKEGLIGQVLGLIICLIIGVVVQFLL